jgi:hypothetical protein
MSSMKRWDINQMQETGRELFAKVYGKKLKLWSKLDFLSDRSGTICTALSFGG